MSADLMQVLLRQGAAQLEANAAGVDASDASAFAQALGGGNAMDMLSAFAREHSGQVRRIDRNLLKAAKTADSERMLKLNKQYSAVMLEQAFATKVVGKTVQGIDAVTKLQ
jgi:hypothetical protein